MAPRECINQAGHHITRAMKDYVIPLMQGEVQIEVGKDGLPVYVRLCREALPRRTGPRASGT